MPHHVPAFSPAFLDSEPAPLVPPHLLHWLLKDRQNAIEGGMVRDKETNELVHDRYGRDYAEKELKKVRAKLTDDNLSPHMRAIYTIQLGHAEGKVQFYEGKIRLLDQMIAGTRGQS